MTVGVSLGLVVLGQGVRRLLDRGRAGWAWAASWRLVAGAGLAWGLSAIAEVLQFDFAGVRQVGFSTREAERDLEVLPLVTTLGLSGLILAVTPLGRLGRPSSFKAGWKSRLKVVLAVAIGLLILSEGSGRMTYLVLMAVDFVQNALIRAPLVPRPILFDRLDLAGLEALPGLVGCLLTAIWIDDDIRTASTDPVKARMPWSWFGVFGRVATVALAAAGGGFVLRSSIPRLSGMLAEGIASIFEASTVAAIVLGFLGLAAGISARAAARLAPASEPSDLDETTRRGIGVWPKRIISIAVGLLALEISVTAVLAFKGDTTDHWYIVIGPEKWELLFQGPANWLGFSRASSALDSLFHRPSLALIPVASAWMVYRMIRLVVSRNPDPVAAVDLVATDRLTLGRFLGWWLALTLLMLASLPILGVVGVTLTHHGIAWMAQ